jgi:hypothetical protein
MKFRRGLFPCHSLTVLVGLLSTDEGTVVVWWRGGPACCHPPLAGSSAGKLVGYFGRLHCGFRGHILDPLRDRCPSMRRRRIQYTKGGTAPGSRSGCRARYFGGAWAADQGSTCATLLRRRVGWWARIQRAAALGNRSGCTTRADEDSPAPRFVSPWLPECATVLRSIERQLSLPRSFHRSRGQLSR